MTSINQDFTMYAGDSKTLTVTVTDGAGAAKNITSATITWKMLEEQGGTVKLTKTVGSGIALTTPSSGIFTVTIAAADTSAFLAGQYYHEAEVTDSGSLVSTVLTGTITLKRGI